MEERVNREEMQRPARRISDDEIDLVQLFQILLKRKWMIIAVTVLLTVSAAGITMVLPKIYEVSTILELTKDAEGELVESPQTIRESVVNGAYDRLILEELNLKIDDFPKFKVTVPNSTNMVKIVVESSEPATAVRVLNNLLLKIKNGIDSQLEVKKTFLQNELKSAELTKELFPEQIGQLKKLVAATERKIADMEKIRKISMSGETSDSTAILLSLNEIHNKQVFLSGLYRELAELKQADEVSALDISDKHLKLVNLKGFSVRKSPEISDKPIKPKKVLIVALALVLGFMAGIVLAFFAEFMVKVRQQQVGSGG